MLTVLEPADAADLDRSFRQRSASDWVELLTAAGISARVLATPEEAMCDEWALAHGVSRAVEFPAAGPGTIVGPSRRLSLTPTRPPPPTGPIGCHGSELLDELGFGSRLHELVASGGVILPSEQVQPAAAPA